MREMHSIEQEAYEFVCWYRKMVMEGQITVTDRALKQMPCSDYELQQALKPLDPHEQETMRKDFEWSVLRDLDKQERL